jgi:hypothetical protein
MRYLANAWNAGDEDALRHVTDPSARDRLNDMHREAMNLRLTRCDKQPEGDYLCTFAHDYPIGYQGEGTQGTALFRAGPVRRGGWYMTAYEHCG